MVQSPTWEANWFAASQEIPRISRNPKVHYRTHKRPPPVSILGQIKQISEIAEVGLNNADPVDITVVLESNSQPLSNEELYDLAQQLTEQQKEDENEEDPGTKEMQMKDLTDILSATDTAVEKACDIDPEWERSSTVKRGHKSHATPLLWNPSRKEGKNQNSWRHILSRCLLNHGLSVFQQNKKWFEWFFKLSV